MPVLTGASANTFAVLTDMRSVGVKDGERTYDYTVALRKAVITRDFVKADWARFLDVPARASDRIIKDRAYKPCRL